MYSPKIKKEYIPTLYRLSKSKGKPMTVVVNEVIEDYIKSVRCSKCQMPADIDEKVETMYCPYCECEVFTEED